MGKKDGQGDEIDACRHNASLACYRRHPAGLPMPAASFAG